MPYAFTEKGVAMLASVLKTSIAANISISIMRAFVLMRKYGLYFELTKKYIEILRFHFETLELNLLQYLNY